MKSARPANGQQANSYKQNRVSIETHCGSVWIMGSDRLGNSRRLNQWRANL